MRITLLLRLHACCVFGLCGPSVLAQAAPPPPAVNDCSSAAQEVEVAAKLPPGLLLAIGKVESGRSDPFTGRTEPWPWTTNLSGEGHYFESVHDAIAWVASQQELGSRSIDVGCFQVNLQYHPWAFSSIAEAFDPAANARYAASFLNQLYARTRSWLSAIALYHSADAVEGQLYASRVLDAWNGFGKITSTPVVALPADGVVVRLAAAAAAVRVELPTWASTHLVSAASEGRPRLPRVFTPGN